MQLLALPGSWEAALRGKRPISRLITAVLGGVVAWFAWTAPAGATLISVSGPNSNLGSAPAIIGAPADVTDDAASNTGMQGFDERQDVLLGAALSVDGGSIAAGTRVNSHMIFLNTVGNTDASQANVIWTFDGIVLGVMSDSTGTLEVASSAILGAIGTIYPAAAFTARGLESNNGGDGPNDGYTIAGNTLIVAMHVTEPGDWIRVVTAVPEPGTIALLGVALAVFGFSRRCKYR